MDDAAGGGECDGAELLACGSRSASGKLEGAGWEVLGFDGFSWSGSCDFSADSGALESFSWSVGCILGFGFASIHFERYVEAGGITERFLLLC
jgi:hypothetical protein